MKNNIKTWRCCFSIFYIGIWQLLRIGAAGLLLIFYVPALFYLLSGHYIAKEDAERYKKHQAQNPDVVCGMISGTVLAAPRKYIMFWPECEANSSWEKDFVFNKKAVIQVFAH